MKINLTSVFVDDQDKALAFYTGVLGFVVKTNTPVGEYKLITLTSPEGPQGVELMLEPNENPAASTFQKALVEQGIPLTSFGVDDVQAEHDRLAALGVEFQTPPTQSEWGNYAVFNDTCGNLIQLHESKEG